MENVQNIILCGVGGQGTILASKVLSAALVAGGYDVKMSEIHGMSQRGGSVTTQVRFGKKVYSPIIGKGSADILVSFEIMEAARYLDDLKENGHVVVNNFKIDTATTASGKDVYPDDIIGKLSKVATTYVVDAGKIAGDLGNKKAMNIVLLGALVKLMQLQQLDWDAALKKCVKPKFIDLNLKAFQAGLDSVG
ncbi:MAG: indolepyruvate oxidoreductase subunit beta [Spirochaetia bacterium]|jgi:indolepyruvate ferredoxin oxidoreductase beta subunit|nr:indolepyruvate oxidoreductase subunit beta [Spirochaetia bacterium]